MKRKELMEQVIVGDYLGTLERRKGCYQCPKNPDGSRAGPLVGYAGKYKTEDDKELARVGEAYFNVAKAEENPFAIMMFATALAKRIREELGGESPDLVLGLPIGGYLLAGLLSQELECRYAIAEKIVTVAKTETTREQSKLEIGNRHTVPSGSRLVIVEDLCNNFSTAEIAMDLVEAIGSMVIAIACAIDRSPLGLKVFKGRPVISVVFSPTPEYKQDDPYVAADVATNNVVWKPKPEWSKLAEAMARFRGE